MGIVIHGGDIPIGRRGAAAKSVLNTLGQEVELIGIGDDMIIRGFGS